MNWKLPFAPGRIRNGIVFLTVLGLLVVLTFFLNALFASRIQQSQQTTNPPQVPISGDKQALYSIGGSEEADPTADWKIYVNPKYGYSVKYPRNWYLEEEREEGPGHRYNPVYFSDHPIHEKPSKNTLIWITVHENPSDLSPRNWLARADKYLGIQPKLIEDLPRRTLLVNGRRAEQVAFLPSMMGRLDVFVAHNSKIYQLSLSPYSVADSQSVGETNFAEMLETFQLSR